MHRYVLATPAISSVRFPEMEVAGLKAQHTCSKRHASGLGGPARC